MTCSIAKCFSRLQVVLAFSATLLVLGSPTTRAGSPDDRFVDVFAPFRTSDASLSPDGVHLAVSVRNGDRLSIHIIEVDLPTTLKARVDLGSDVDATALRLQLHEHVPLAILWMRWVTPTRLVVMTNKFEFGVSAPEAHSLEFRTPRAEKLDALEKAPPRSNSTDYHQYLNDSWHAAGSPENPDVHPKSSGSGGFVTGRVGAIVSIELTGESRLLMKPGALEVREVTLQPRIVGLSSADPVSLCLTGQTSTKSNLLHQAVTLNTETGKLKVIEDAQFEPEFLPLIDQQGRVRGGLKGLSLGKPPFQYVVQKPGSKRFNRWEALDRLAPPGSTPRFQTTPATHLGERAIPLGFDDKADVLYYASNIGRDTFGIYALDTATWRETDFAVESTSFDLIDPAVNPSRWTSPLIFDRFSHALAGVRYTAAHRTTHWLKPKLQSLQRDLESLLPNRSIEILEWDQAEERFLVLVHGPTDAGAFYICEPAKNRVREFVPRMNPAAARKKPAFRAFSLVSRSGHALRGMLLFPHLSRARQIPVVVRCPSEPWEPLPRDYRHENTALTEMGFAVLHVESRGAWGTGIKTRASLAPGYERALLDDILETIDQLAPLYRIDTRRVALIGERHGGFVALRGAQLHPDRFRCAIAIDAPVDLKHWLENDELFGGASRGLLNQSAYGDQSTLANASVIQKTQPLSKPVCLIASRGAPRSPSNYFYSQAARLAATLEDQGMAVVSTELRNQRRRAESDDSGKSLLIDGGREFARRLPYAKAAAYREFEYFLNTHLYDYAARPGPLEILPEPDLAPRTKE